MNLPIWLSIILIVFASAGLVTFVFFIILFIQKIYIGYLYNKEGIERAYKLGHRLEELDDKIDVVANTSWVEIQKLSKKCHDEFQLLKEKKGKK